MNDDVIHAIQCFAENNNITCGEDIWQGDTSDDDFKTLVHDLMVMCEVFED